MTHLKSLCGTMGGRGPDITTEKYLNPDPSSVNHWLSHERALGALPGGSLSLAGKKLKSYFITHKENIHSLQHLIIQQNQLKAMLTVCKHISLAKLCFMSVFNMYFIYKR